MLYPNDFLIYYAVFCNVVLFRHICVIGKILLLKIKKSRIIVVENKEIPNPATCPASPVYHGGPTEKVQDFGHSPNVADR